MRIVLFVGSPVHADKNKLAAVGKKLRKCNVAVDIVSFGEVQGNAEKLEAFINAVNKNNNSNLVTVRPGAVIADVLLNTPMFLGEDASAVSASGFAAAAAATEPGFHLEVALSQTKACPSVAPVVLTSVKPPNVVEPPPPPPDHVLNPLFPIYL